MEQKRELVCHYVSLGMRVTFAARIAGLKRSTYYYKPNGLPKGKQPTRQTFHNVTGFVDNEIVIKEIIDLITPDFHDYGYQIITILLKQKGYSINHKKVRRIMRDNQLLHPKNRRPFSIDKTYTTFSVPPLEKPFQTIEADIKYVYIHGSRKNAYLLSFLCTFCRSNPTWSLEYTMQSHQVIELVRELLNHPLVKKYADSTNMAIKIRTDNGPQFIAKKLAQTLELLKVKHEFIKPGTPEQNGHIESFHSTFTRLVCDRHIFEDLSQAKEIIGNFFFAYNNTRVMKAILYHPPTTFLKIWETGAIGIKKDKNNKQIFFFREKPALNLESGFPPEVLLGNDKNIKFENRVLTTREISPV